MRFSAAPAAFSLACAVALSGVAGGAAAVVPQPAFLAGVDVSLYQHGTSLDWAKVKAAGQDFAFVKATEGTGYVNSYFAPDWAGLGQVGMARGAYHFARPNLTPGSAAAQAQHFVQVTGLMHQPGALAPMFDIEDAGGLTPAQLAVWSQTWLDTVQALTGRKPTIYTYAYFWQTAMGNSTAFTGYPLFLADYHDLTGTTAPRPGMPGGWTTWTFWQYSDRGNVPGISGPVDMDRYNGPSVLAATWGRTAPAPAPAPGIAPVLPLASYRGQLLQVGSAGPAVTALQKVLGSAQDGSFGPMTATSLRTYQAGHRIPTTGVTDARTWTVLVPVLAPKPVPVPVANPLARYKGQLLTVGSRGTAVVALQKFLRVGADGDFGPMTRAVLIRWQQAHRVPATGVTDARTWTVLVPVAAAPKPVSPLTRYRSTVLRVGSRGTAVIALQKALRIGADGDFGSMTLSAVMRYQQTRHLPLTGVVTSITWDALIAGR